MVKQKEDLNIVKAVVGDRIAYKYYGLPATGIVTKVLVNSVITTLEGINKKDTIHDIFDTTVVAHKNYTIIS